MEQLELFTLGNNLVTAGHCLDALAKANDMMQALLNATRVSDVHDMHDDYPTLPAIVFAVRNNTGASIRVSHPVG